MQSLLRQWLSRSVRPAPSANSAALQAGESITATVVGVPTGVLAKTVAANGGSMADTSTWSSTPGIRSDLAIMEVKGQTTGTAGATGASTTSYTDWSKIGYVGQLTNIESTTAAGAARSHDAVISEGGDLGNTQFYNMDGLRQNNPNNNTASYYVSVFPRPGSTVVDMGAYTVQFQLTDSNGVVISTKTVKIDFVSTPAKSDATVAIAQSGTFLRLAALATTDSTGNTYANLTLRNRDNGNVRTNLGAAPTPTVKIQQSTAAITSWTDTGTLFASDTGLQGTDFGNAAAGGTGTLKPSDGVYGLFTSVIN